MIRKIAKCLKPPYFVSNNISHISHIWRCYEDACLDDGGAVILSALFSCGRGNLSLEMKCVVMHITHAVSWLFILWHDQVKWAGRREYRFSWKRWQILMLKLCRKFQITVFISATGYPIVMGSGWKCSISKGRVVCNENIKINFCLQVTHFPWSCHIFLASMTDTQDCIFLALSNDKNRYKLVQSRYL